MGFKPSISTTNSSISVSAPTDLSRPEIEDSDYAPQVLKEIIHFAPRPSIAGEENAEALGVNKIVDDDVQNGKTTVKIYVQEATRDEAEYKKTTPCLKPMERNGNED